MLFPECKPMRWRLRLAVTTGLALGLAITAAAQWPARYDGPSGMEDTPTCIKLDGFNNVYVSGTSYNTAGDTDMVLIKYNSAGVLQWTRRYLGSGGEAASSVVAIGDGSGAYITGVVTTASSGLDYIVVKYDGDGNMVWARQYNGPGNGSDYANASALDASGNLYVTGKTLVAGFDTNYTTVKYDSSGTFQWARHYDGTAHSVDEPLAMAIDLSGNVVVTGRSVGTTSDFDYATVKYSPTGVKLWARRYDGPASSDDSATCVCIDVFDNIYVAGNSIGGTFSTDYFVRGYSPTGATLWSRRISTPGEDYCHGIVVDGANGAVFVTGTSGSDIEMMNYLTVKIHAGTGARLWSKTISGHGMSFGSEDSGEAIGIDGDGNCYVTGHEQGDGTLFDYNYFTLKYAPDGTTLYKKKYDGPLHVDDYATHMFVHANGTVYVTGFSQSAAGSFDIVTVKY